jgi:hypothetical protein
LGYTVRSSSFKNHRSAGGIRFRLRRDRNDHDRSEADKLASPELKNVAKLPATAVTTKMAHASRPTSIIFPTDVTGFVILDETVSNCTEQKKAASPNPWIFPPF